MRLRTPLTGILLVLGLWSLSFAAVSDTSWVLEPRDIDRVYDGDTFYITLNGLPPVFGDGLPIRLLNIDTPELRSRCKTPELKDEEKRLGRISRDYLIDQLQQATAIQITHLERGSFFRVVADVYVDNRWLNERMVAAGHAVGVYDNSSADWCQIIQDRWDSE